MNKTKKAEQFYQLLGYVDDGFCAEKRAVYVFRCQMIVKLLKTWAQKRNINKLIDIGSSSGFITERIQDVAHQIIAVDADKKALSKIKSKKIKLVKANLPALASVKQSGADIVISFGTLYYLDFDDLEIAIRRIRDLLLPGGFFIVGKEENTNEISTIIKKEFQLVDVCSSPVSIRNEKLIDYLFWAIEARFLFCKALLTAQKSEDWDIGSDFSEHKNRPIVKLCLRYSFVENFLWVFWPLRFIARLIWGNKFLFKLLCVRKQPMDYLWVYQKCSAD